MNLDRADKLIEIATNALENHDFPRYKRAMRLAKKCLRSTQNFQELDNQFNGLANPAGQKQTDKKA